MSKFPGAALELRFRALEGRILKFVPVFFLRVRHRGRKLMMEDKLMTEGSIWKKILFFSIPLILGNLLQQMYNTVDSIIVGNYVGSNALAAVGSSTSLIGLLIAFSQGASVGAGVIVAQHLGAGKKKEVQTAVHTALAVAVLLGLVLSGAGLLFSPQVLTWMGTPEAVMKESVVYLRIYSGGLIFSIIYNMAAGVMNSAGNSRRPLLYLGIASVTNIILDLVLIRGLNMGVAGAAVATDISQLLSCVLALIYLIRVNASYRVRLREIRIEKRMASSIIKVGLPTGIQNMVISFSNVLVQASVNSFGAMAMAGFGAYLKVDGFNILPVMSFSMAVTTFVGQNYGAGKTDRVRKGMWVTVGMSVIYTALTGVLLLAFAHPVIGLFSKDPEVIAYGVQAMKYFCPFYFLLGILHSLAGAVRGTGKTVPPMVILLAALCVFRVFWVQLIVPRFDTIDGVYLLYPVSWALGLLLMAVYTWKGNWLPGLKK